MAKHKSAAAARIVLSKPEDLRLLLAQHYSGSGRFQNPAEGRKEGWRFLLPCRAVPARRYGVIILGFFVGLLLASLDHILPATSFRSGPTHWVVVFVDWV